MVTQGWRPDGQDDLNDEPPKRIRVGIAMPQKFGGGHGEGAIGPSADQLDGFCKALGASVDIAVTVQGFSDYRALLSAVNRGDTDLAWLPPLVALRSANAGRTLPIVLPIRNRAAWYASALFAPATSNIASIRDLLGARVAWVDPQSTAGYLVIRAWMRSQNLNFGFAFRQETFCGTHDSVVDAVLSGQADVGAAYAHLDDDQQTVRSAAWGSAPVKTIALAGPIPNDVLSASVRLPVVMIRTIRDALVQQSDALRSASAALFNAEGFIAAETAHMSPLMKLLRHIDHAGRRGSILSPT